MAVIQRDFVHIEYGMLWATICVYVYYGTHNADVARSLLIVVYGAHVHSPVLSFSQCPSQVTPDIFPNASLHPPTLVCGAHSPLMLTTNNLAGCTSGAFYKSPKQGDNIDTSQPISMEWDTSLDCFSSQGVDIYLYAPYADKSMIHAWGAVDYSAGSFQVFVMLLNLLLSG